MSEGDLTLTESLQAWMSEGERKVTGHWTRNRNPRSMCVQCTTLQKLPESTRRGAADVTAIGLLQAEN